MTILDYLELSNEGQWDELLEHGKKIAEYKTKDGAFSLFVMDNFFVELEREPSGDELVCLHPFVKGERLQKYINDMDVNEGYFF